MRGACELHLLVAVRHDQPVHLLGDFDEADRVTERELDPRWVLPVDVVRDEDVAAGSRDVLRALETPWREERRESANGRKPDAPDPEPLLRKDRRSGEHRQERVT